LADVFGVVVITMIGMTDIIITRVMDITMRGTNDMSIMKGTKITTGAAVTKESIIKLLISSRKSCKLSIAIPPLPGLAAHKGPG
jgi:hypothetical protein